jgi:olefin beta-lactone synthetase
MSSNIADLFFAQALEKPKHIAIIDRDGAQLTFGELADAVKEMAAYYHAKGIGKNDRVLVFVPMSLDLYISVLAIFHLGATAVFLDEWVSRERLELCCKLAKCKAFIASWKIRALAFMLSPELRRVPVWLGPKSKRVRSTHTPDSVQAEDLALITFTTGSTGIPKAAKRTHGFLQAQFEALVDKIQPQPSDIDMPVLPIVLLLNLGTGVTSVIADYNSRKPLSLKPERLVEQIRAAGVNRFTSSPYVLKCLAEYVLAQNIQLSFRRMFTGGAPVFPLEAGVFIKAFPDSPCIVVYGSTEAEPISSIEARELSEKQGKGLFSGDDSILESGLIVGIPYRLTRVKILPITTEQLSFSSEDALEQACLPTGKIGEIVVSGPHVLRHYVDNPEAEKLAKIFIGENVWHRTGDSGFFNTSGELFLCGRCSTLIPFPDGYLASFAVEYNLAQQEGIVAGTVLHERTSVFAVIEATTNADKKTIQENILSHYAYAISKVYFIEKMPRDPRHFSKIDYGKLNVLIKEGKLSALDN